MKKQESMKSQGRTCVLRVDNIHCDGCKGKIRKLLRKIDGVYATSIDMDQGKVTVTGNVDPALLIRKLEKLGKHAEIWRSSHNNNTKHIQFDDLNNQFRSLQMGNVKGGGGDKTQYNNHQIKYQPSVQEMKGFKTPIKMKDQRTVKFDLHRKGQGFDEFSEDDEFDEDEDFGDEDEDFDDEEFEYGGRQHSQKPVNGDRTKNGNLKMAGKEKKKGVKKGKKVGGGGFMSMILGKAIGRKGKDGKVSKKCGSGGKSKGDGVQKHGGGEGKNGNKGSKNGKFSDFEVTNHHNKGGRHGGGGGGGMGQYRVPGIQGPPRPQNRQMMMNMAGGGGGMGQYRPPGVQGPPPHPPHGMQMMSGGGGNGYYPGPIGGPMGQMNPYQQQLHQQQQQQYMAMMMNQQRIMDVGGGGGDMMYHPAAYGRPQPGYGYAPAMVVPPSPARVSVQEPYTYMFSDENTGSCSIM